MLSIKSMTYQNFVAGWLEYECVDKREKYQKLFLLVLKMSEWAVPQFRSMFVKWRRLWPKDDFKQHVYWAWPKEGN